MEAATRSPSWANTQPWEIFVASGDTLERLRQSFLKNFHQDVPINPELPAPREWPPALKERTQQLTAQRFEAAGIARDDEKARRANVEQNVKLIGGS